MIMPDKELEIKSIMLKFVCDKNSRPELCYRVYEGYGYTINIAYTGDTILSVSISPLDPLNPVNITVNPDGSGFFNFKPGTTWGFDEIEGFKQQIDDINSLIEEIKAVL